MEKVAGTAGGNGGGSYRRTVGTAKGGKGAGGTSYSGGRWWRSG